MAEGVEARRQSTGPVQACFPGGKGGLTRRGSRIVEGTSVVLMAQVTLKDIARVAGVHFTTVSMALRGNEKLPLATRQRIRKIADRMGYTANPVYSALTEYRLASRGVKRPRMAYLVNRPPELGFNRREHHSHLLDGATRQARLLGYDLELLFVDDDHHDSRSLAAYLRKKAITGFIISGFEPGLAEFVLDWDRFSVIKINSFHIEPAASVVTNDHEQIVRLAFRRLWDLGYRRIGMAVGRGDEVSNDHRYTSGLLIEQSALPEAQRVRPLYFPYNAHRDDVVGLIGRWCARHRIDAVLCNWSNIESMLRASGFSVPDKVACACLRLGAPTPDVAGVVVKLAAVGGQAVAALARQMRAGITGSPRFPTSTFVAGEWQDGPTAPARQP